MSNASGETPLSGQIVGNKFLIRRVIGSGGMGAVYEAEHVVTKRVGALKLLHESRRDAEGRVAERFLREASAAGRIGNPHIVETLDAGELPDARPYIFMELLSGNPLRELLKKQGRIPFALARELLLQAAEGLSAAHGAGIVHRDVKPDNLFVCDGEPPFLKILDFGISKFVELDGDKRLTQQGSALGTPHYMSPEQVVSKREIDARVDVYALGVVLYECVTGKVPFDAESLPALGIKIFEGDYAPPSELASDAPPGLDALIARAMARDPGQRFASMLELRDALAALAPVAPLPLGATSPSLEPPADEAALRSVPAPRTKTPVSGSETPAARSGPPAPPASKRWAGLALGGAIGGIGVALALAHAARGSREPEVPSALPRPAPEPQPMPPKAVETTLAPPTPSASAQPVASAAPSAPPRARAMKSAPPLSSAARDGLVERNPFAD